MPPLTEEQITQRKRDRRRRQQLRRKERKEKPLRLPAAAAATNNDEKRPPLSPVEELASTPLFHHALVHLKVKKAHKNVILNLLETTIPYNRHNNFYSVYANDEKNNYYTYSYFPDKGHLSVYGLTTLAAATCADTIVGDFCRAFGNLCGGKRDEVLEDPQVLPHMVNICGVGDFTERKIDIREVYRRFISSSAKKQQQSLFRVVFNTEACTSLRLTPKSRGGGMINLFSTGKYVCLGARKWERVRQLHKLLCVFMKTL